MKFPLEMIIAPEQLARAIRGHDCWSIKHYIGILTTKYLLFNIPK